MRPSALTTALIALAPTALARSTSSSTPMTSMVPMMAPSAPPVTMAWNDAPSATESAALTSEVSSLNSAMQSAVASVSMEMESGMGMMTMSDGSVMATGSAMAEMSAFEGSAGRMGMELGMGTGAVVLAVVLSAL